MLRHDENIAETENCVKTQWNAQDGNRDLIRHLAFIILFFVYSIIELSNKKPIETMSLKDMKR